jgi:hypothetical protein
MVLGRRKAFGRATLLTVLTFSLDPVLNSAESAMNGATVHSDAMGSAETVRVDQAAIERSWRERGFSCGLWVDPPGQVWADYVHDTDELVIKAGRTTSCS